ncbi:MAG: hypothetical protein WED10_15370, partial [Brumimicrobium sp.]
APGVSFNVESHRPQDAGNDYEYFTTSYRTGVSFNLGMTNKLNYKKLFVRVNANIGILRQSQKFTFSNEVDNIIEHTVDYQMPYWSLDYSLGRDFELNELNKLHVEFGFSTVGDFNTSSLGSEVYQSGSFMSEYVEADDHYDGVSSQEYQYDLSYEWQIYLSPFIRCSISLPMSKNRLSIGVIGRWNSIQYDSFIYITGGNYSAIASSALNTGTVGLFLNYEF